MASTIYTADNRAITLPAGTDSVDIGVLTTDLTAEMLEEFEGARGDDEDE